MAKAKTTDENHGTFEKDGETKVAPSRRAAVQLRFDGWKQKKEATGEAAKAVKDATTPDPKQ